MCYSFKPAARWWKKVSSHCLFQRGELAIPLVLSTINGGESCSSRGVNMCRVWSPPCFGELVVHRRHEGSWPLTGGRMTSCPFRNHSSRRPGVGSSGADHSRPSSSTACVTTRISSESTLGCIDGDGGGASGSLPEHSHSSASDAVKDMKSSTTTSS